MDHARCLCAAPLKNPNPACPLHGVVTYKDPRIPWKLSEPDRNFLWTLRIDPDK